VHPRCRYGCLPMRVLRSIGVPVASGSRLFVGHILQLIHAGVRIRYLYFFVSYSHIRVNLKCNYFWLIVLLFFVQRGFWRYHKCTPTAFRWSAFMISPGPMKGHDTSVYSHVPTDYITCQH